MVLWCKICGAFMGLREPINDWSVDRTGVCKECAPKGFDGHILSDNGIPVEPPPDDPKVR